MKEAVSHKDVESAKGKKLRINKQGRQVPTPIIQTGDRIGSVPKGLKDIC